MKWRQIHFTGIGGVGMTGLALILADLGVQVSGTDAADPKNLELLAARGVEVHIGHDAKHVGRPDVLVYSTAVPEANCERRCAAKLGIRQVCRGDFLAELAQLFPRRVAVAGSHGKTTVSAMLSHLLIEAGWEPGYLVGGSVTGREFPARAGKGEILVTEVDESDGTQAKMHSTHAIVTNVEDDHCWSLGGVENLKQCFRDFAGNSEYLLAWDTPAARELFGTHPNVEFRSKTYQGPNLRVPGRHNRSNAALAIRMAVKLGLAEEDARRAILSFQGVDRRLSIRWAENGITVVEDYAHHPTELREAILTLRETWPGARLRVVFQPHRHERVARYAAEFSRVLSQADEVVVTAPFAAWLEDADVADPKVIAANIGGIPAEYSDAPYEELAARLAETAQTGDLIAVIGAGTITKLIEPLTTALKLKTEH